jgi:hypothetical protein
LGLPEGHDQIASLITIREGTVVQMRDFKTKAEALVAASESNEA